MSYACKNVLAAGALLRMFWQAHIFLAALAVCGRPSCPKSIRRRQLRADEHNPNTELFRHRSSPVIRRKFGWCLHILNDCLRVPAPLALRSFHWCVLFLLFSHLICTCDGNLRTKTEPWPAIIEEVAMHDESPWLSHPSGAAAVKVAAAASLDNLEGERAGQQKPSESGLRRQSLTTPGSTPTAFVDPLDIAIPNIALKTNNGISFGGSVAANGNILILGWQDRVLASPDTKMGTQFYVNYNDLWSNAVDNSGQIARTFATEEMGCYQFQNVVGCIVLDLAGTYVLPTFDIIDANGDGRITQTEFNSGFNLVDKDGNGFVTRDEYGMSSSTPFDILDIPLYAGYAGDNRLSREEWLLSSFDLDDNGVITREDHDPTTGRPLSVWAESPLLGTQQQIGTPQPSSVTSSSTFCDGKSVSTCYGIAAAAHRLMLAATGAASDASRYVQVSQLVYNTSLSPPSFKWRCLSGCSALPPTRNVTSNTSEPAWPQSQIWSTEASYGDALALEGFVLAVGAPRGINGEGYVDVWTAVDPASANPPLSAQWSGGVSYRGWSVAAVLSHAGSVNFGARLMLKNGILAVAAPGGELRGSRMSSVHIYSVDVQGRTSKLCDFWRASDDFGASVDMQRGRGNRHTVVVGEPSKSRAYAILVRPEEEVKCIMQTLVRRWAAMDLGDTDRLGSSLAVSNQFLFVGAPGVIRRDSNGQPLTGLFYILSLCTEGNYYIANNAACASCGNSLWAKGAQVTTCSSCIPARSTGLGECNFVCDSGYFGRECLPCSQAMNKSAKPSNSDWVDGGETCSFTCHLSFMRVNNDCLKCSQSAEDKNGVWIPNTCGWTCKDTFFAAPSPSNQSECAACSVFQERIGAVKPENSEWVDGWKDCTYGPEIGYNCAGRVCVPCQALATNTHWTNLAPQLGARCDSACDQGYFGPTINGSCVTCADYLEREELPESQRPRKPARSEWENNMTTCNAQSWRCVAGTYKSSFTDFCCPNFIENSIGDETVGPCKVRCKRGFWWDETQAACRICFPLPERARWLVNASAGQSYQLGNCSFRPQRGYNCSGNDATAVCMACMASKLPMNASYADHDSRPCTYTCNQGFFGPATVTPNFNPSVCERCAAYMQRLGNVLPKRGLWDDGETCSQDSWSCSSEYIKSESDRYCCPVTKDPNAVPWPNGRPCKFDCNPGYNWSYADEKCNLCPAKPPSSEWTSGCKFSCNSGFFGSGMGVCLNCRAYRAYRYEDISTPLHSTWSETSLVCGDTDWVCDTGFTKNENAGGCCPTELPEGGMWECVDKKTQCNSQNNADHPTCGILCAAGYAWDPQQLTCLGCPPGSRSPPSSGGETYSWGNDCSYECNVGYIRWPPAPARVQECVMCSVKAMRSGWSLPTNAQWVGSSEDTCQSDAWVCNVQGYIKSSGQCCATSSWPVAYLELMNEGKGMIEQCAWRCRPGYFPSIPRLRDQADKNQNCMTCRGYLKANAIDSCYESQGKSICAGKVMQDMPTTCFVEVLMKLALIGELKKEDFTGSFELAFRQSVADSVKAGVRQVIVTDIQDDASNRRAVSAPHRRAASSTQLHRRATSIVQDISLSVTLQIRGIEPYNAMAVKQDCQSKLVRELQNFLVQNAIAVTAEISEFPTLFAAAGTWTCKSPYVYNVWTGKCCPNLRIIEMIEDPARYFWKSNGCVWTCRPGFEQIDSGSPCMTCTEYNERLLRFKPPNSYWRDGSPGCTEWACNEGFVRSSSGYSCIQLTKLVKACNALERCAKCSQDGDCVWCNGTCSAGVVRGRDTACPYMPNGSLGLCSCETKTCSRECLHTTCSECVADQFCGWCAGTGICMQGSYFRPSDGECPQSTWIASGSVSGSQCGDRHDKLWMIGLVCATGSTLLVAAIGAYVITRIRAVARREEARRAARSVEQQILQREAQRYVHTFPTFKFTSKNPPGSQVDASNPDASGAVVPPADASAGEDDEDEPTCSICLGVFIDGEELRMLPCVHVFHATCIDQWLGVSHECPLCKRSVVNNTNQTHFPSTEFGIGNSEFADTQVALFTRDVRVGIANDSGNSATRASAFRPPLPPMPPPPRPPLLPPSGVNEVSADVRGVDTGRERFPPPRLMGWFTRTTVHDNSARNESSMDGVAIEMQSGMNVLNPNLFIPSMMSGRQPYSGGSTDGDETSSPVFRIDVGTIPPHDGPCADVRNQHGSAPNLRHNLEAADDGEELHFHSSRDPGLTPSVDTIDTHQAVSDRLQITPSERWQGNRARHAPNLPNYVEPEAGARSGSAVSNSSDSCPGRSRMSEDSMPMSMPVPLVTFYSSQERETGPSGNGVWEPAIDPTTGGVYCANRVLQTGLAEDTSPGVTVSGESVGGIPVQQLGPTSSVPGGEAWEEDTTYGTRHSELDIQV